MSWSKTLKKAFDRPSLKRFPVGHYQRGRLGDSLYLHVPTFDLDVNVKPPAYNSLHDPWLKKYFNRAGRKKFLIKQGLITPDEKVPCTKKEFIEYMDYFITVLFKWEKTYRAEIEEHVRKFVLLNETGAVSQAVSVSDITDGIIRRGRKTFRELCLKHRKVKRNNFMADLTQEVKQRMKLREAEKMMMRQLSVEHQNPTPVEMPALVENMHSPVESLLSCKSPELRNAVNAEASSDQETESLLQSIAYAIVDHSVKTAVSHLQGQLPNSEQEHEALLQKVAKCIVQHSIESAISEIQNEELENKSPRCVSVEKLSLRNQLPDSDQERDSLPHRVAEDVVAPSIESASEVQNEDLENKSPRCVSVGPHGSKTDSTHRLIGGRCNGRLRFERTVGTVAKDLVESIIQDRNLNDCPSSTPGSSDMSSNLLLAVACDRGTQQVKSISSPPLEKKPVKKQISGIFSRTWGSIENIVCSRRRFRKISPIG